MEVGSSLLIRNARVYLFDDSDSTADSILIEAGRVAVVGEGQALLERVGAPIETWNVRGATILPGLIDTHPHLLHFAVRQAPLVDITTAGSHDDIVQRIADRAKRAPAGEWILTTPVGEPYYFIRRSYKDLKEGELPTRHVLDRATDKNPVAIQAWEPNIPNTAVFNSLALRELGISRDTGGIRPQRWTSTIAGSVTSTAWLNLRGKASVSETPEIGAMKRISSLPCWLRCSARAFWKWCRRSLSITEAETPKCVLNGNGTRR
jgi:predicted amidohydrolase YtcJ